MSSDKAHNEKSPSYQLSEVGPWVEAQIYKARKLAFSNIDHKGRLGLCPTSSCAAVGTGLLKTPRTQLKKHAKMTQY